MTYDVVVVGGGIGGLTAAALLTARGVSVCLLERESQLGGCLATFEKFGYTFEPSTGLYAGWETNGIHQRVFAELGVTPPSVHQVDPSYVVRLADGSEVSLTRDTKRFESDIRKAFPECADAAIQFYRQLNNTQSQSSRSSKIRNLAGDALRRLRSAKTADQTFADHLVNTSTRFRNFIDAQLFWFAQTKSDICDYFKAAAILDTSRGNLCSIEGGASTLVESLAASIRARGGKIRLNTPVLRLAFDTRGNAIGVDLLSGETVQASKAIISNLTVWDTYGKLIGLNRISNETRKELSSLKGTGVYLLYATLEETALSKLPSTCILSLAERSEDGPFDEQYQLAISISSERGEQDKRAVTIQAFTDVDEWFTFHQDESEHESRDQAMMELCWQRLHAAFPELGDQIEVIDTATPRTFYEQTRRKLGMVGGLRQMTASSTSPLLGHTTSLPNVFRVGDTSLPGAGVASVTASALLAVNELLLRTDKSHQ